MQHGASVLSDAELLAIILRTGTKGKSVIEIAKELLRDSNGLRILSGYSTGKLQKTGGIGKDKAATLIAAFELGRRAGTGNKWLIDEPVKGPHVIGKYFCDILKAEQKENFIVVCLNTQNRIIKYEIISTGSLDHSIVHPREVFKVAIDNLAKSIILVHNHPSGNPEPSLSDIQVTKRIADAGRIFEIPVLDHMIIAGDKYTSLNERGII